ncbi:MAG: MlaD family protein [Nitrospirota bacterium]|nr:MlaD family protein [Nitrospirota bacterium]
MRELSTELKVGAFALIVLAVLAFMTFKVGGLDWAKKKGYAVHVVFSSTAGLDEKTRVKIAGVDSGVVEGIGLVEGKARVKLRIDPGVKIYKDAQASIRSSGLLGDKYLDIRIGSPEAGQLKDGDVITDVMEVADMDDLARNLINVSQSFTRLTESLNEVLGGGDAKKSLSETIANLREVSSTLNRTITLNDQRLRNVLDNINTLTASLNTLVASNREPLAASITNMKDFSASLKSTGPELIENLNKATKDLKAILEENRPGIRSAVDSFDRIAQQVDKGEGTLGKLVKDDRLYDSISRTAEGLSKTLSAVDRFRAYVTFQAEYLTRDKDGKASFDITLQPDKDKYFILGVVGGSPRTSSIRETTKTPPGKTVREEELSNKLRFNAQFGKRFDNAAARLGLFENSFGLGGDYFFNDDKGKITVDVWDFQKNEENAKTVHIKAGVSYFLFKNLFLSAGGDNLMSKRYRGGYVGMGVRFDEENFR